MLLILSEKAVKKVNDKRGEDMNQFETLIRKCDAEIRAGHPQNVAKLLARLNVTRVPRANRLPLARICRRAGLLSLGLRILSRRKSSDEVHSPGEAAEYAMLLLRSGAVSEALKRLYQIDTDHVPDALLFRAYGHFGRWEYAESIPELKKYLAAPTASQLLGRTNLAFAYVECREHSEALALLEGNVQMAREQHHLHLECYNHALRAQVMIQDRELRGAKECLISARRGTLQAHTHDQFFITKLELICEGLAERNLTVFAKLRELSLAKRDWSALRDADFFALKVRFDQAQFLHLFFGSPLPRFRELLGREFGGIPARNVYVLGAKSAPRFDLVEGSLNGEKMIQVGGKCHQLLEALLRDFYEPVRTAGLHSLLFPNEFFNIASSPDRIRQLIRRTRAWLHTKRYPVEIRESDGFYRLQITGDFSFRIPLERQAVDLTALQVQQLKRHFGGREFFSTQDICQALDVSTTTAHRLLREGISSGVVLRIGPVKRPIGYKIAA